MFRVPYLNTVLSVAGSYSVGGQRKDEWMQQAIQAYGETSSPRLPGLAYMLRVRLESEMTKLEKDAGSLIHMAGYVAGAGADGMHPEFFFVRNLVGIDPQTGSYTGFSDEFVTTEDFWTRDYQTKNTQNTLASGGYQLYINGYPAGRIGYLALTGHFGQFLQAVWSEKRWSFRSPRTLGETSLLVELQLRAIGTLFAISDYPAPYIGGEPQIEQQPPPGCVVLGGAG